MIMNIKADIFMTKYPITMMVLVICGLFISGPLLYGQQQDSLRARKAAEDARVKALQNDIRMTIQNVDITRFPEVRLVIEAVNSDGSAVDTINAGEFTVLENGSPKKVISIEKISVKERIPIDFVFVIDVTATMGSYINGVRNNIENFVKNLVSKGIDYRIGLVLFSDVVEKVYNPTEDVKEFNKWLSTVWASGGGDDKENALEGLVELGKMKYRPSANRVAVIITDAQYHQRGDRGHGRTMQTTETITQYLKNSQLRLFCITPVVLREYYQLAEATHGAVFDITQPFAKILDAYSTQLTNLFAITYRSDQPAIPDSLSVGIVDQQKREIVKKTIPVVELGRKLIIENLLFPSNSSTLPDSVLELEILLEFMNNKPNVVVRIEGHTDSKGNKQRNKVLSLLRAEAVRQYLIRKGIKGSRILTEGFGDTRPIADNASDFGRRLNRRTEVVIVSK
jgi:outer membrane protein OmpA-like peptidoglycan-associated protein